MAIETQTSRYENIIEYAKKYLSPKTIDTIEHSLSQYLFVGIPAIFSCQQGVLLLKKSCSDPPIELKYKQIKESFIPVSICMAIATIFRSLFTFHNTCVKNIFIQNKLKQISEKSNQNSDAPSVLTFLTSEDSDGVCHKHALVERYEKLAQHHRVDVVSIDPITKFPDIRSVAGRKYDRVEFLAHGNQNCIDLSPKFPITKEFHEFFDWLSKHVKNNSKIIVEACSTAKGDENVAKEISKACPTSTVYAAQTNISGSHYTSDGTPTFYDGYLRKGKDVTRIYRNGIEVPKTIRSKL